MSVSVSWRGCTRNLKSKFAYDLRIFRPVLLR